MPDPYIVTLGLACDLQILALKTLEQTKITVAGREVEMSEEERDYAKQFVNHKIDMTPVKMDDNIRERLTKLLRYLWLFFDLIKTEEELNSKK